MARNHRGPYAPRRQAPVIDWAAQQAASAAARAEQALVEEQVRRQREQDRADQDPLNQVIRQLRTIDDRGDSFDRRFGLVDEQAAMLIDMVGELRDRVAELEGRTGRLEGLRGRFGRRKTTTGDTPPVDETHEEHEDA